MEESCGMHSAPAVPADCTVRSIRTVLALTAKRNQIIKLVHHLYSYNRFDYEL